MTKECKHQRYSSGTDRSLRERDYDYARTRAGLSRHQFASERVCDLLRQSAEVFPVNRRKETRALVLSFRQQVERWKEETGHLSSETKAIAHPSYLRIIGLSKDSAGHELERLMLQELESEPDLWFAALSAVTGEDPVKPEHNFDESVEAWLAWGRKKRII